MTNMLLTAVLTVLALADVAQSAGGKETLATQVARVDALEAKILKLNWERTSLQEQIQEIENHAGSLLPRSMNLDKSAFTVTLSNELETSDGSYIIFNTVLTDTLGDYSTAFGFFETRDAGLHLFSVTVTSPPGYTSAVYLNVISASGSQQTPLRVNTYNMQGSEQESGAHTASVIVNLAVGDEVSVVATGSDTIFLSGEHTTLFSGYYI